MIQFLFSFSFQKGFLVNIETKTDGRIHHITSPFDFLSYSAFKSIGIFFFEKKRGRGKEKGKKKEGGRLKVFFFFFSFLPLSLFLSLFLSLLSLSLLSPQPKKKTQPRNQEENTDNISFLYSYKKNTEKEQSNLPKLPSLRCVLLLNLILLLFLR